MASGRPPGLHPAAGRDEDLMQMEESTPIYSTGQRPPVNDDNLLRQYNIDDSDQPQPRPSVSYDSFVGGRAPPAAGARASTSAHPPAQPGAYLSDPYSGAEMSRT